MIRPGEPNDYAAEILFYLPQVDNPREPKLGHVFTLGEVQIKLAPTDPDWIDVALNRIVERGRGWYAIRLTAAQRAVAREIAYQAVCDGAQPDRGTEIIGNLSGDIAQDSSGVQPFFLANEDDPVNGPPLEGRVFTLGEVILSLPDAAFDDVAPSSIVEFGGGLYGVIHTEETTAKRGKSIVVAAVAGARTFSGYRTILGALAEDVPVTPLPEPIPPPLSIGDGQIVEIDHAEAALNRLVIQFRKPKIQAFVRALCKPMQRIERGLLQVIAARNVDTAPEGVPLDIIGRLVGQPHVDVASTSYRSLVRARIPANRSSGMGNQVLRIVRLVLRDYVAQEQVLAAGTTRLRLMNYGHASYVLVAENVDIPWELAELVAKQFLGRITATGVRARFDFVVQQGSDYDAHDNAFSFGSVSTPAIGTARGSVSDPTVGAARAAAVQ